MGFTALFFLPGDDAELVSDGENLLNYEGEFNCGLFIQAVVGNNSDELSD